MTRRVALCSVLIAMLLLSGCQKAGPGGGPGTAAIEYTVGVEANDPSNIDENKTIINSSDPQIKDLDMIQEYLQKAPTTRDEYLREELSKDEFEELKQEFESLPSDYYGERATIPKSPPFSTYIYIYHNGDVIRITISAKRPG